MPNKTFRKKRKKEAAVKNKKRKTVLNPEARLNFCRPE
jgi:hypothetical protein